MKDIKTVIKELQDLYKENLDFIASVTNGTCKKTYRKKTMAEYKKVNSLLEEYILDIQNGIECDKDKNDWCTLFGDILAEEDEEGLDDDNFPLGGW